LARFIDGQTPRTDSIGQSTEKVSVIQVIHAASLDHAWSGPDYPVGIVSDYILLQNDQHRPGL
jgi:hypothetical protein